MSLLLVSNRLPVTLRFAGSRLDIRRSPGGVAVALASVQGAQEARWFGWPGDVPPGERNHVRRELRRKYACHPVFLPARLGRRYYGGFANRTLWPLFHSFPMYTHYAPEDWAAYREANEIFADAVAQAAEPTDTIWVHDYHLLLLPAMLRERLPEARIGLFLHIPFPSYDVFRLLPWGRDVLAGMLGSDLVGFHTYDYAQSFLHSVRRVFGLDNDIGRITWGRRVVQADVFPMGADVVRLETTELPDGAREAVDRLRPPLPDGKLAFSISRLDYTKGIPEGVLAFERLLHRFPEYRGRVTYLLIVVPSREKVERYALLKKEVDELVGRINSRFGSLSWTPIRYMYRQLPFSQLLAMYRVCDIAMVLPLRDGMNLVAKEFLAARGDDSGALVLSEMTGAAKELTEALLVNPNNIDEVSDALHEALRMPLEEQVRRNRGMRVRLEAYDTRHWAQKFLERLREAGETSRAFAVRILEARDVGALEAQYRAAKRRLLLLDYDGTLVPFADDPGAATPSADLLRTLRELGSDERNRVVLVSGRRREDLERWFGHLPVTLVGEHGGWVREPGGGWTSEVGLGADWMSRIRPVLDLFVDRVPGTRVEPKDFSLAWHYRAADRESGTAAAMELVDALTSLTANLDLHVLQGHRVVEVKSTQASKGHFFATHLAREPWDFILAVGDDTTDESLFPLLPPEAVSIRVGLVVSSARYNVAAPADVIGILERLALADEEDRSRPQVRTSDS